MIVTLRGIRGPDVGIGEITIEMADEVLASSGEWSGLMDGGGDAAMALGAAAIAAADAAVSGSDARDAAVAALLAATASLIAAVGRRIV